MNKPVVIAAQNIGKSFRRRRVLTGVTFAVNRGEIFGILGKNGAGKTVLINILLGLIRPDTGSVSLFGRNLKNSDSQIRRRINVASPFLSLQTHATIWDNLRLFARLYGVSRPGRKIEELLGEFGITELAGRRQKLFHLSAGEMTRTILCKAFLNDPEIVFLDEPTAALDPVVKRTVVDLIKNQNLKRRITFVYTSHHLDEITSVCSRVLVIRDGSPAYLGPTPPAKTLIRYY